MRKPSPAMLVASLALVFAMTGTGVAASRYLITSRSQIAPSVLKSLKGKRGLPGTAGAAGAPGLAGATGATGAPGVFTASNLVVVDGPTTFLASGGTNTSVAICPAGDTVVSGGWAGPIVQTDIGFNEPVGTTEWEIIATNESSIAENITAVAVCAS